eukprot:UN19057
MKGFNTEISEQHNPKTGLLLGYIARLLISLGVLIAIYILCLKIHTYEHSPRSTSLITKWKPVCLPFAGPLLDQEELLETKQDPDTQSKFIYR